MYGSYDNYVVINKQGIVRYHAADLWPFGNRYHLDEIRGTVDSLVIDPTDVEIPPFESSFALSAAPNPFGQTTTIELMSPVASPVPAAVVVYDIAGSRVATLWNGAAPPGRTILSWDGRRDDGGTVSSGLYYIRARLAGREASRRILYLR